jgi:hypothetical protein
MVIFRHKKTCGISTEIFVLCSFKLEKDLIFRICAIRLDLKENYGLCSISKSEFAFFEFNGENHESWFKTDPILCVQSWFDPKVARSFFTASQSRSNFQKWKFSEMEA